MDFKKGDIAICTKDFIIGSNRKKIKLPVTIGKEYEVIDIIFGARNKLHIKFKNDLGKISHYLAERFKPKEAEHKMFNERKFKIGEKIKCVQNGDVTRYLTNGKIYEVHSYHEDDKTQIYVINDYGKLDNFFESRFVSIQDEQYREEEMQALLIIANKGREALMKLYKMAPDRLTQRNEHTGNKPSIFKTGPVPLTYELQEEIKLKPFTCNNWEVKLHNKQNGFIHVGCKQFKTDMLIDALKAVLFDGYSEAGVQDVSALKKIQATRSGIVFDGHKLPYEQAEELYNKIKHLKD